MAKSRAKKPRSTKSMNKLSVGWGETLKKGEKKSNLKSKDEKSQIKNVRRNLRQKEAFLEICTGGAEREVRSNRGGGA